MLLRICFLIFLTVCAWPSLAQTPSPAGETPEAIAQQYVETMRSGDWNKGALLMHPDALKSIRNLIQPIVESAKTEKDKDQLAGVFGVSSKEELAQMSDVEVFAKFMNAIMGMVPDMRNILNSSAMQLVGKVGEKDDLQHIVYRMTLKIDLPGTTGESIPFSKLDVMTLRRFENTWRLELKGDMEGMIKAMAVGLAQSAKEEPAPVKATPKPKPATQKKRPIRK